MEWQGVGMGGVCRLAPPQHAVLRATGSWCCFIIAPLPICPPPPSLPPHPPAACVQGLHTVGGPEQGAATPGGQPHKAGAQGACRRRSSSTCDGSSSS